MHRTGVRTSKQLTDAAVGFHKGEPWKVGPGRNRGGEQVSPQKSYSYKRIGITILREIEDLEVIEYRKIKH